MVLDMSEIMSELCTPKTLSKTAIRKPSTFTLRSGRYQKWVSAEFADFHKSATRYRVIVLITSHLGCVFWFVLVIQGDSFSKEVLFFCRVCSWIKRSLKPALKVLDMSKT